jgi:peptidoglycan/LPS O-acetylase OafA/YrhL
VFFLISGWLVGGSLLNKLEPPHTASAEDDASPWRTYLIDRMTRLWTVLVPALLLMLLVGAVTASIDRAHADFSVDNEYSVTTFAGNLIGLQTLAVKNFGGNYALWSLANETWYYVQFPLLLLMFTSRNRLIQGGAAAALMALGAALPLPITLYFTLWLLGAAFSRIRIDCGNGVRIGLIAVVAGCSMYSRVRGSNDDLTAASFLQDLVYSLPLLVLLSSLQAPYAARSARVRIVARVAHILSEFSFTLYVTHIPVIKLLRYTGQEAFGRDRLAPDALLDYAVYAGMLAVLLAAAWLSYLLFESHTFRVRRAIKHALQARAGHARMASSSMK